MRIDIKMIQTFKNQCGYDVAICPECKQQININSFIGEICCICHEDNKVKIFEVTEGDYNDVFRKNIIKATGKRMDQYCKDQFDKDDDMNDLGNDNIGYECYYPTDDDGEVLVEYYIEAIEIEDYKSSEWGDIEIDLTNEDDQ